MNRYYNRPISKEAAAWNKAEQEAMAARRPFSSITFRCLAVFKPL